MRPKVKAFKFVKNGDLEKVLGGSLKFGRLKYYQLLEAITGDCWIGDRNEGAANLTIEHMFIDRDSEEDRRNREIAASMGLKMMGNGQTISGFTVRQEVDCFAFCTSEGTFEEARSALQATPGGELLYGSCIEISDLCELTDRIAKYGSSQFGPLGDQFDQVNCGPVVYETPTVDVMYHSPIDASALRKSPLYAAQREARILVSPRETIEADALFVSVPDTSDLFEVRQTGGQEAPTQEPVVERAVAIGELQRIQRELSALDRLPDRIDWQAPGFSLNKMLAERDEYFEFAFREEYRSQILQHYWAVRSGGEGCADMDDAILRLTDRGKPTLLLGALRDFLRREARG